MPDPQILASEALRIAEQAFSELVAFADPDTWAFKDFVDAATLSLSNERTHINDPIPWIHTAASSLVQAARIAIQPIVESDVSDVPDAHDGYLALTQGDLHTARQIAESLLAAAAEQDDDQLDGDLMHNGHILLGKLALESGDTATAVSELLAAASSPGPPLVKICEPDLSLAWQLLAMGEDAAVIGYLRAVSRYWTPV